MHHFEIKEPENSTAILFCRGCATSYILMKYPATEDRPARVVWEQIDFQDYDGQDIEPPAKPWKCEESQ